MSATKDHSQDRTFLIDLTRCTGCRACQVACKQWNQLQAEKTTFFSGEGYQNPPALSERTLTTIRFRDYPRHGENEFAFYKEMCMHCNDPACASVCPVSAFTKTPEGMVIYKPDRCIGCRFCMIACPFGIPKYEWSKVLPLVVKCTGCYSRVKEGLLPACAKACPSAITYGKRADMIALAKERLRTRPDVYYHKIYGLDEAGGTSVLYLSELPFPELGFKLVTPRSLPDLTWKALRLVPTVFLTMGGTLAFVSWLTHRKDRLRREEMARGADGNQRKEIRS
jgi:formate dehydrogenase iron-sulfur subunit